MTGPAPGAGGRPLPNAGGRPLPGSSPFAGDDGSADAELAALLDRYATGSAESADVVARLAVTRVLVPVLAHARPGAEAAAGGGAEAAAGGGEREAAAGVVALAAPDGRRALPVFTSVATLANWRADARPVPVPAQRAALSAVGEDWALLVVDPAGPVPFVVPRPAVWALAQGEPWRPAVAGGAVDPDVVAEIERVLGGLAQVYAVHAEPGRAAEVAIALGLDAGLDRAGLDAVLAAVNAALASSRLIADRVDALELRIGRAPATA